MKIHDNISLRFALLMLVASHGRAWQQPLSTLFDQSGYSPFIHTTTFKKLSTATIGSCQQGEWLSKSTVLDTPTTCSRRLAVVATSAMVASMFALPRVGEARDKESLHQNGSSLLSASEVSERLRSVPTFAIVDPKGAPFMVVGYDAKVTGYFFTDYDEAKRILDTALKSADKAIAEAKKDPDQSSAELVNPWIKARISSVPLDFAVALSTKSKRGAYFQVAPSEKNIEAALELTGKDDLAEGKVPLFYMEDFKLDQTRQTPLYFSRKQLEDAYLKQSPGQQLPDTKVTELFSVILEMVKPGGTDEELQTLVFVPPTDSKRRAKECEKLGGTEAPFLLGERIVVL